MFTSFEITGRVKSLGNTRITNIHKKVSNFYLSMIVETPLSQISRRILIVLTIPLNFIDKPPVLIVL